MENKYLTYDPLELAADESFIQWVQAGRPSDSDWGSWVARQTDFSETIREASELVTAIQFGKAAPSDRSDAIWNRINTTIAASESEQKIKQMPRRNVFRLMAYAAAACVAALLTFQVFMTGGDINIDAGYGETIAYVLPDDSKVTLNAGSSIAYDEKSWSENRSLTLDGEAYFEVEKGQKFSVHTPKGIITVLGTSFNIYSRADGFRVHCTSGKVKVTSNNDEVILTPNTQTSLTSKGLVKENLEEGIKVNWLDKIYEFDATPLEVVFASIERQFDIEIASDSQTNKRLYTGSYTATDLDKALNVVCFPMELTFEERGTKITITPDEGN